MTTFVLDFQSLADWHARMAEGIVHTPWKDIPLGGVVATEHRPYFKLNALNYIRIPGFRNEFATNNWKLFAENQLQAEKFLVPLTSHFAKQVGSVQ